VAIWFGRGRLQERAEDSDDSSVTDDTADEPTANEPTANEPTANERPATDRVDTDPANGDADADAAPATPTPIYATTQDARSLAAAADALRADRESDRAISALRAATTAAGTQPTLAQITEVRRLHEATIEAARHPRRFGSKASARRRLEHAIAARTAALEAIGFDSFETFTAVYGPTLMLDRAEPETDETIARICELLIELGVNPTADPLRAASEFLTVHEAELVTPEPVTPEPVAIEPVATEPVATEMPQSEAALPTASVESDDEATTETPVPVDAPWFVAARFPTVPPEPTPPAETPTPPLETSTPPAEPAVEATEPPRPEGDVVDRWISAEARAERMHAEVERAQAELAAMLARSEDLEETAVARVDELEAANLQLQTARRRVDELEAAVARLEHSNAELLESNTALHGTNADHAHAVAELVQTRTELDRAREEIEQIKERADSERGDLERALTASRDRVTELETSVANRERSLAEAEQSRAHAREALTEREDELAGDRAELDQARARVAELETELASAVAAHAAELAQTRARTEQLETELTARTTQLEAARTREQSAEARTQQLEAELETTRRSLEALDTHAEQVEAQLANARRAVDSLDVRRELDTVRKELADARHELGHLELQRAETARALAHDGLELQQLQQTLMTMRDQAVAAEAEVTQARHAVDEARVQADTAVRARDAVTVDAADILARAEAEASGLLERANRDAEAIRQEAMLAAETISPRLERPTSDRRAAGNGDGRPDNPGGIAEDAIRGLAEQVGRLERKIAKQRRRLDRLTGKRGSDVARPKADEVRQAARRDAVRRDREQFQAELVDLVSRFASLDD
jgi:chromosome segregation ATPase